MTPSFLSIAARRGCAGAFVVAAFLVASCGDDGGTDEAEDLPDCALDAGVSGGASADFTMQDSWGCASPFGSDAGIWMIFLPGGDTIGQIEIDVADVAEGATGTFPARNGFISPDGDLTWTTADGACSVEITSNEKTGEDDQTTTYLVVGSGSCTSAAEPVGDNPGEAIQLAEFEFRFPSSWFK
jgi:hypothetical protein